MYSLESTKPRSSPSSNCMNKPIVPQRSSSLKALIAAVPYRLHTILTENGIQFADLPRNAMVGRRATGFIASTKFAMSTALSTD